ncbi:S9 family peptidase [Chitinimonas koreensis]|uniref:S9 family peptidase n=1 Tax=Chitinimonas koreensis TaxID=356302 RepID=UPI0003F804AF|nr:S9 family peptidase [Chitinimonas koreensis]QNM96079.1 S9 family peptidase [Chitinimonas koreensis]
MKRILVAGMAGLLAAAPAAAFAEAVAVPKIPVRDFFKNPDKTNFQLSPNGKYISFTQGYQNRLNIHVMPRGGEARRVTEVQDRDIRQYFWKGDDHLLFLKDNGGDENFHLFAVDRDGKATRDLTPFDKVRVELIDDLEDHPTDVLVGLNKRNPEIFDAYRLNVKTGEMKLVAENPGNITGWVTDHAGRIRVATATDGVTTSLLFRKDEASPFKAVLTTSFKDSVVPLFFTFDNKRLYAASNLGRDKQSIVELDPASGKELKVVYQRDDVDVETLRYSKKRKVLTLAAFETSKPERHFFDKQMETLVKKIEAKLPGYEVNLTGNRNEDAWIVAAWNDRTRGTRYYYDPKADKLEKLADVSPWLNEQQMATMKPIEYKSRDGLTIHGYLTLPAGKEAKNLPVIVNPHGGPWARDSWGFNPEVQFLANRGYAVLQMNFRGSTGYGKQFWQASFKQWGKTMQDDVSDGVQQLVKDGVADAKRVCIYGGSYGGYATLAGLTFSPELYACGVDYVGVSNLFTFMKTIPPYWKPYLEMMYEMVGNPEKDTAQMEAASPVFHVDKIKAPLLVLQGAKDPRVNIAESDQIVDALKKRGVEVEYIVKENEGHGFANQENRFDAYEAMERFFAKHLGS